MTRYPPTERTLARGIWRVRAVAYLVAGLLLGLGVVTGWFIRGADCGLDAAERLTAAADSLRAAQCRQLAPTLRPGLC